MFQSQQIGAANVGSFLADLATQEVPAIDLRATRMEEAAGAALAAALLAEPLASKPLAIAPPPTPEKLVSFAGAGLFFALANRPGKFAVATAKQQWDLSAWRRPWTPGCREQLELFAPMKRPPRAAAPLAAPGVFEPERSAAFINPHLSGPSVDQKSPVAMLVPRWLRRMAALPLGEERLERLAKLIHELVENVTEWANPNGEIDLKSLVSVAMVGNSVVITVLDTGVGLISSLQGKGVVGSPADVLAGSFSGSFQSPDSPRKRGLPLVLDVVREWRGKLDAYAGVQHYSSATGRSVARGFELQGTVIAVSLPVGGDDRAR